MTGLRPPIAATMLDKIEQITLQLIDVTESLYYVNNNNAMILNTLWHQQKNCLFITRNNLVLIENADPKKFKQLDNDLNLIDAFIHNVSLIRRNQTVSLSISGRALEARAQQIKQHNNKHLNTLNNDALIELIYLCPTVRLGQHYIREAYPRLQKLTDIIDRCFYQTYQLVPELFLAQINDFQHHIKQLVKTYKSSTLNDALKKACKGLPEYNLQLSRLKVLAFCNTYLLLSDNDKTKLKQIDIEPLSQNSHQVAIDLVNKYYDQLITQSLSIDGANYA